MDNQMTRYTSIPPAEANGLYWYFSPRFASPEPVLVGSKMGEDGPIQMIKRFNGGFQRFIDADAFLLGPVQPPVVEGVATSAPTATLGGKNHE